MLRTSARLSPSTSPTEDGRGKREFTGSQKKKSGLMSRNFLFLPEDDAEDTDSFTERKAKKLAWIDSRHQRCYETKLSHPWWTDRQILVSGQQEFNKTYGIWFVDYQARHCYNCLFYVMNTQYKSAESIRHLQARMRVNLEITVVMCENFAWANGLGEKTDRRKLINASTTGRKSAPTFPTRSVWKGKGIANSSDRKWNHRSTIAEKRRFVAWWSFLLFLLLRSCRIFGRKYKGSYP